MNNSDDRNKNMNNENDDDKKINKSVSPGSLPRPKPKSAGAESSPHPKVTTTAWFPSFEEGERREQEGKSGSSSSSQHHGEHKEFRLKLPAFTDLYKADSVKSQSTGIGSQFYHSAHSQAASDDDDDDYYMSEGSSELSYFNAKPTLDSGSDLDFADANDNYNGDDGDDDDDDDDDIMTMGGLGSIEAFSYHSGLDDRSRGSAFRNNRRNARGEIDFLKDPLSTMTYGRRIALYLSKRYAWYNPQLKEKNKKNDKQEQEREQEQTLDAMESNDNLGNGDQGQSRRPPPPPSIAKAWAYFEHITLPRRKYIPKDQRNMDSPLSNTSNNSQRSTNMAFQKSSSSLHKIKTKVFKGNRKMDIAVPGENKYETKLYHPITTPLSQMGDFGLGVGLYFSTLRAIMILMLLAGIMNIPNFMYFASDEYSKGQVGVQWFLKGSAVCNVHEWVPCPECTERQFRNAEERLQVVQGETTSVGFGEMYEMTFALKNNCDGAIFRVGMVNFGTTLLILVGMIVMRFYLEKMEVKFDEDEQTAQDYSIVVRNPPHDAVSPEEWRDFFMTNFHGSHVTCCTVGVDNDDLLHALVARRELLQTLEDSLPNETDFSIENLAKIAQRMELERNRFQKLTSKVFGGVVEKYQKMLHLNSKIVELSQTSYPASSVFVTFENEHTQRLVLEKMTVALVDAKRQNKNALSDPNLLFRCSHVCFVEEPAEPSTIRWQDQHVTNTELAIKFITTGFVLGLLAVSFFVIGALHDINATFSAFAISISNAIFPTLAKMLSKFEKHRNEEQREVWLYIKIAIFRCVNSAVIILIITPYTSTTLGRNNDLLAGVYNVFFAEIVTSTILQLLDIGENFKRHIMAPRAKSQEAMNLNMRGTEIFLAERYTNMTKLVFLAIWHCPLYPGVLFMCAVALFVNFFSDRFSLMRSWKPSPKLGRSMSSFTRDITFPVILMVMAFVAVRSWENFTYDSLCSKGMLFTPDQSGTWQFNLKGIEGIIGDTQVTLNADTISHYYCGTNNESMTEQQMKLTSVYARFTYTIAACIALAISAVIGFYVKRFYTAKYAPCGEAMNIPYSQVESRTAYIPQVKSESFAFPFLACPVAKIRDCDLFEWEDPHKPYDDYDITQDSKQLLLDSGKEIDESLSVFGQMIHIPPVGNS
eukprot:CAMPEP_0176482786 /NCGR_PEP_ID=MMETSP0200_2-20121128/3563_1 /TAXON_ID=947934 /ORGANISM="Chaetoceros sp., Strain GSL56" /LENGTH=1152 /DNA_ID=CAMNT_0017879129 /DNA_START=57 /DNA_END=3516 /DNA_ORIENTATION=+